MIMRKFSFVISAVLGLGLSVSAASLQGVGAMGEDVWPTDAAALGRGMAGSAMPEEGFSLLNPARMAFDTKTRFNLSLDYQGVYARQGSLSLGRDRFDISGFGFSVPLRSIGAFGFGIWQSNTEFFKAISKVDSVQTASVQHQGSIFELVPSYALRLPSVLRFISIGAALHVPMGQSTHVVSNSIDTTQLDSVSRALIGTVDVEDRLTGEWGCKDQLGVPGYISGTVQIHSKKSDFFVSGWAPHTLTQTFHRTQSLSSSDTVAQTAWEQEIKIPWQWVAGLSLEPWSKHHFSVEFFQRSTDDSVVAGLGWEGVPAQFDRNGMQRTLAIGWQHDGSFVSFDPFFTKNSFRAGAWAREWYLKGVSEAAGTVGIGIPLGKRGAKLDFALYSGIRDFSDPLTGYESFWGMKIGLSGIGAWGESLRHR